MNPIKIWHFAKKETLSDALAVSMKLMRDSLPIGTEFTYLGGRCVVADHLPGYPFDGTKPYVRYEYRDNNGVIHSEGLSFEQVFTVKKSELS